ncbi:MAG: transcriptional regulator [Propionibacteriaceae bacterium]|nr:MAG: transcriptional regulator [Propionibacteriaceae bacterium]
MTETVDPVAEHDAGVGADACAGGASRPELTCEQVVPGVVRCDAALSHVFEILGKRWNGVIVGALSNGPATFSQLGRGVTGISDSVLSDRLSGLAAAGIVTRVVDSGPPVAVTYALTGAGRALLPAMDQLRDWAQDHLPLA